MIETEKKKKTIKAFAFPENKKVVRHFQTRMYASIVFVSTSNAVNNTTYLD
jgi:hypothetical protein